MHQDKINVGPTASRAMANSLSGDEGMRLSAVPVLQEKNLTQELKSNDLAVKDSQESSGPLPINSKPALQIKSGIHQNDSINAFPIQAKRAKLDGEEQEDYAALLSNYTAMVAKGKTISTSVDKAPEKDKAGITEAFQKRYDSFVEGDDGMITVKTKPKSVERVSYYNLFLPETGAIKAIANYKTYDEEDGEKVKELNGTAALNNSDILMNQWILAKEKYKKNKEIKDDLPLKTIVRAGVMNKDTIKIVNMIHSEENLNAEVKSTSGSDDYYALISTPNVRPAAFMIKDYKKSLPKFIPSITTKIGDGIDDHDSIDMIESIKIEMEDIPGPPPPEED